MTTAQEQAPISDVGVAIARKQQQQQQQSLQLQQQQSLQQQSQSLQQQSERTTGTTTKKKTNANSNATTKSFTPRSWWSDLLQGSALYLFCLVLPTLLTPLAVLYQQQTWVSGYITTPLSQWITKTIGAQAKWTDLGFMAVFSISLAIIRITIVLALGEISGKQEETLQAMVRCKSIHLLSSAYPESLTPTTTSKRAARILSFDNMPPPMPSLTRSDSWLELTWDSVRKVRLHAAPRYATAVFRTLYCTLTITMAFLWFRKSTFWPPLLGGHGSTKHCWSLKGGVALDESFDFDDLDTKLKLYFLVQASYHIQSGAFHIIATSYLWYHHTNTTPTTTNRISYTSYGRSLLQHGVALCFILGAHLFSATRRLGAVGAFCLDVSSVVLHILQVCINHPTPFSPMILQQMHRWIVIPVFLGMRFYMWPCCVWYSAAFESKDWLEQMESTMIPGMAKAMYGLFHVLTIVLLSLNLILMKRLLYHPHLQRLLEESLQGDSLDEKQSLR